MSGHFINFHNLAAIENFYTLFQKQSALLDPSWIHFFEGFILGETSSLAEKKEGLNSFNLIQAYRSLGHRLASINPLSTVPSTFLPPELTPQHWGFSENQQDSMVPTWGFLNQKKVPLKTLIQALKQTYCGTIGIEYMHLSNGELRKWLQKRIEPFFTRNLDPSDKLRIFRFLNKAEFFETFLHTKYVGQKRFSLEGAETILPMLNALIEKGGNEGIKEIIMGMAHRGRLNVLANIVNKPYSYIFSEFEDQSHPELPEGTGDVKYHQGFSGKIETASKRILEICLAANPSHLESVDPVVMGMTYAKQDQKKPKGLKEVLPILIHGDASFAGQGVIYETLQLMSIPGYKVGGTIHFILNNQIGFTTSPEEGRSTLYCTDIAKGFDAPVFHVNAEDVDGCIAVSLLGLEIRQLFQKDVFIDLNCYRKYGHNEGDEPTFTQPREYAVIKNKTSIRRLYQNHLIEQKLFSEEQAAVLEKEFKMELQKALEEISSKPVEPLKRIPIEKEEPVTAVNEAILKKLADRFCHIPPNFSLHPKIAKWVGERKEMMGSDPGDIKIDWSLGEHLAYASLLIQGVPIRLSGQDTRRGTFSHRHAGWVDQKKGDIYLPLAHLQAEQASFEVFNSILSEYAVLGFEFGYTISYPQALVIWEAQFGDFANGAQVVIDQFIATSEQKWGSRSSLVLMLPHGYEGQGPEHSSARIERFLQLCGSHNLTVANCTTPAQLFHLLRQQALKKIKKPLILFTPKSLLRHPFALSALSDFTSGQFQEVLDDPISPRNATVLLLCSGKVYYDLLAERKRLKREDVALLRLEQLYPFPEAVLEKIHLLYPKVKRAAWVQEEPSNMGAWEYICPILSSFLKGKMTLDYVGRKRAAAPDTASHTLHNRQKAEFLNHAFKL
jgi:2-oxoglutarate dehydrogenase E1 component